MIADNGPHDPLTSGALLLAEVIYAVEHPAMTMIGVFVDTQIGHQHDPIANLFGQICQAQLHNSLRVEGLRADGILGGWNSEQDHGPDAEIGQLGDLGAQAFAGVLHDSRQGTDRLWFVDAFAYEQGRHEIGDVDSRLCDKVSQSCRTAQSSGA